MLLESFIDLVSASPWTYAVILAVAAFDALVPVVPSEATVISAGVLAGAGDLDLALVVAAGAIGAYVGDSSAYWLGRRLGRLERRIFGGAKGRDRRAWAERTLERHGVPLVFGARFVPGGRTATTVTAGLVRMRWLRFATVAAAAGVVWASYAAVVGYVGGRAFEGRPLLGLAFGFGIALAVYAAVETARAVRSRARPLRGSR
jgi:membrane-associated protein